MNKVALSSRFKLFSDFISDWFPQILLACFTSIIPAIVYLKIVPYEGIATEIFGIQSRLNFFTYFKSLWLMVVSATVVFYALFKHGRFAFQKNNGLHRPLFIFGLFTILSAVFAQHQTMAVWGDPHHHEGMIVWLCYVIIVLGFAGLVKSRIQFRFQMGFLIFFSFCLAIIGSMQFFGHDFFEPGFISRYLIPLHLKDLVTQENLSTVSKVRMTEHIVTLTMGNGNFVGMYMAMMFSVSLAFLFKYNSEKSVGWGVALFNFVLYICLLGSKSRTAMIASLIVFAVMAFFMWKKVNKNALVFSVLALGCLLMPFVMDAYSLRNNLPRYFSNSFAKPVNSIRPKIGNFNDIKLGKDQVTIVFDGVGLTIKMVKDGLELYDQTGEFVPYRMMNAKFAPKKVSNKPVVGRLRDFLEKASGELAIAQKQLEEINESAAKEADINFSKNEETAKNEPSQKNEKNDEFVLLFPQDRLRGYEIHAWPGNSVIRVSRGAVKLFLGYTDNGFKLLNQLLQPIEIKEIETLGFSGREKILSGRGYIWSRTLPLLKRTMLIGYGPDTFVAHYPNDDYLGKLRFVGDGIRRIIDKPHNFYLQVAVNHGILALMALFVVFFTFFQECFSLYCRCKFETFEEVAGLGIALAVFSFLATGFLNDSTIMVAPVFWGLLGLGFAVNRLNQSCLNRE